MWNFIAVQSKLSLKLWGCWIKWCLLSEEGSSNAGALGCMLPAEDDPFKSVFSELPVYCVDRLLSLKIRHKGCAMCYSWGALELQLHVLESSRCCWLSSDPKPAGTSFFSPQHRPILRKQSWLLNWNNVVGDISVFFLHLVNLINDIIGYAQPALQLT